MAAYSATAPLRAWKAERLAAWMAAVLRTGFERLPAGVEDVGDELINLTV